MSKAVATWLLLVMYLVAGTLSAWVASTADGWTEWIDALAGGFWYYLAFKLVRDIARGKSKCGSDRDE